MRVKELGIYQEIMKLLFTNLQPCPYGQFWKMRYFT